MNVRKVPALLFLAALFAAPAIYAAFISIFALGGEYGLRFAQVGAVGLIFVLPAWFLIFPWLARRLVRANETSLRAYTLAGVTANMTSLLLVPALLLGMEAAGLDPSGQLQASFAESGSEGQPVSFTAAVAMAAATVFFLGMFFLPPLAAMFGWMMRKVIRAGQ